MNNYFNKKSILVFLSGVLVLTLSSCFGPSKEENKSSDKIAKEQSSEQKKTGLVVINVLDKEEFDDCHIKGSINIPFTDVEQKVTQMIDKNATIVLYCSNYMCSASGAARDMLIKMGYKEVYAYEGGTAEWFQMGLPVEGPSKKAYLSVKMQEPKGSAKEGTIKVEQLKKKLEENKNI